MARKPRQLRRPLGEKRYKKLFLLATEGTRTEPEYFERFNDEQSIVRVRCLKSGHKSAPPQVLKRMAAFLRTENLMAADEAWLVIDRDQWTEPQIEALHRWTEIRPGRFLALSNPKFEYWLLLHYEDGAGIGSVQECSRRLKACMPDYDKGVGAATFSREQIEAAVSRARRRDQPPSRDWPRTIGGTTVYRLVENILRELP
jgi:hypothetical protein